MAMKSRMKSIILFLLLTDSGWLIMNINENTLDQLLIQRKYKQKYMSSFGPFGEQLVSHKDYYYTCEDDFKISKYGSVH
jgi:hypothetical protein